MEEKKKCFCPMMFPVESFCVEDACAWWTYARTLSGVRSVGQCAILSCANPDEVGEVELLGLEPVIEQA